ncbi:MAG: hypothetical protein ACLGIE_12565 [Alphaproteobacteria bacterium]
MRYSAPNRQTPTPATRRTTPRLPPPVGRPGRLGTTLARPTLKDPAFAPIRHRHAHASRAILARADHRSTDQQAQAPPAGDTDRFAAWTVEARLPDQILLADVTGRTRSWLMVAPREDGRPGIRLLFGSAIVTRPGAGGGRIGKGFRALTALHVLYSRALLSAAAKALTKP